MHERWANVGTPNTRSKNRHEAQLYISLGATIIWIETKKKQFTKVEGKKKLEKGEERDKWEEEEVIKKRRREVSGWPGNVRRGKRLDEAVTMAPHDPQL